MRAPQWAARVVALQAAGLALVLATVHSGPIGWALAVPAAGALVLLAAGRWHGRWLSGWLGDALRYRGRATTLPASAGAGALLAFARPTAGLVGSEVTLADAEGVVAVLDLADLADPAGLLADAGPRLPVPTGLVPAAGPTPPDSRLTVQLLIGAARPGGTGPASTSYRQLTDGAVPARQRALLAVRLSRVDGGWPGEELHRALPGTVRRLSRHLTRNGFPCRPLDPDAARAALAELGPLEPAGGTGRESWSGLLLGGWAQTCLRAAGAERRGVEALGALVPRLLRVPAGLVTVSVTAADTAADLVVRLAARSPDGLVPAVAAARQIAGAAGLGLHRLDGAQRAGLSATLPLAIPPGGTAPGLPARGAGRGTAREVAPGPAPAGVAELVVLPPAGLMLGRNRQGGPVAAGLFGPGPTWAVLLGGVRAAQALTLRALALDAQVAVQTARPHAWEPFLRAVSLPVDTIVLLPPGPVALPAARPSAPQLLVLDVGAVGAAQPVPAAPWRASLVLRDEVTLADADLLGRADLAILQPLTGEEAELAGRALGLTDGREWLCRMPAGMVGAVARPGTGRAVLRWALLSPTDLERQLIGSMERVATG